MAWRIWRRRLSRSAATQIGRSSEERMCRIPRMPDVLTTERRFQSAS
jgi:hypothetical protein